MVPLISSMTKRSISATQLKIAQVITTLLVEQCHNNQLSLLNLIYVV